MARAPALECPKCKKPGLVRLENEADVFECVYCHYRDDLRENLNSSGNGLFGIAFFLILTLGLALSAL